MNRPLPPTSNCSFRRNFVFGSWSALFADPLNVFHCRFPAHVFRGHEKGRNGSWTAVYASPTMDQNALVTTLSCLDLKPLYHEFNRLEHDGCHSFHGLVTRAIQYAQVKV